MSVDLIDQQLEAILIAETERLFKKAESIPLEVDEVRKLSLLLEINEKRKVNKPKAAGKATSNTFRLDELLSAVAADNDDSGSTGKSE